MTFKPQSAGNDYRINPSIPPPFGFIAATVQLAVVTSTQWHGELIAWLAPKCPRLRES
jgi:hypothetical protein